MAKRTRKRSTSTYRKRKSKNKYTAYLILLGLLATIYISHSGNISWEQVFETFGVSDSVALSPEYEDELSVHVLDVGKADAIYIHCGDKDVLIDAGDVDITKPVTEYLKRKHVEKLDLVMVSHQHRDHFGGMKDIINTFPISRFMMPELPASLTPTGKTYESVLLALRDKNMHLEKPPVGESFELGNMNFQILGPLKPYDSMNNNSIVVKLSYGDNSFLFTGDAEKDAEKDILKANYDLRCDVLKVGHHGSATSTTQAWLNAINPRFAVVSVGPDRNNLPKADTIKRLKSSGAEVYRTDLNGTVVFCSNGKDIRVSVGKEAA